MHINNCKINVNTKTDTANVFGFCVITGEPHLVVDLPIDWCMDFLQNPYIQIPNHIDWRDVNFLITGIHPYYHPAALEYA
jgi:hypothetical protein